MAEAGQQPCCPASALSCSPNHPSRLPPPSAPLSSHSHPFATCSSASTVPMFPVSLPSSLLLPPHPARPPAPLPVPHCCCRLSGPVPLGPSPSVAVACYKRDSKRTIRIKEESRKDKKIKKTYPLAPSVRQALSFCAPPVVVLVGNK